ncbi:hypothetical protein Tco_1276478, partial [Tanacetum coccineum]
TLLNLSQPALSDSLIVANAVHLPPMTFSDATTVTKSLLFCPCTVAGLSQTHVLLATAFRATQRAAEIRSRPPTKTQLRNLMVTYLKNMGGYKHSQLKEKTYKKIQGLYEREQKFIHDFVPMDSEKEEKKSVKPESEGKKSKILKRIAGSYATQKSPKKPKVMKSVKNVTQVVKSQ